MGDVQQNSIKIKLEEEKKKTASLRASLDQKTLEIQLLKQKIEQLSSKDAVSKKLQNKYTLIDEIVNSIFGKDNLYQISWEIANIIAKFLNTDDCVIYATIDSGKYLEQIAASGDKISTKGDILNKLNLAEGEGVVGTVAKTGKSELIHDTSLDARYVEDLETRYSELTVPIIIDGKIIGVIDSEHSEKNHFTKTQLSTVESIGNIIALKLKNAISLRDQSVFERQLLKSQTRLYSLISSLEAGVLLEDENRNIVITNEKFCGLFEIPVDPVNLIGQNCSNAAAQSKQLFNNPDEFVHRIDVLLKDRKKVLSEEIQMANGTFLERDYIPIYNNDECLGHLWSYRDATLKHNYQQSLEFQKQKYSNIISNMNLGLIEVDNNDAILMANKSFSEMSGYQEGELLGKKGSDVFLDDQQKKNLKSQMDKRVKGESGIYEIIAKNKLGQDRYWLVSGAPNYNLKGDMIGSIGIHLDVTEQKKLEIQKETLLKRLKTSNEELEEYAHIVSHDLKSPLRNVSALTSWIKSDNIDRLKPDSLEHFEHLELTLEKMESLISGILEFASVTENSKDDEKTNLQILIQDLITTLHIPEHIHIEIKKQMPVVVGDAIKLQQIFQNIISNAIEYIDKPKGLIVIDFIEKKSEYEFSISDNGVGIEEKYFQKIFKIFNSLHKKRKNSGVGLSIVKKVLDLYNCNINIKSTVGEGTTFYFTLKK